MRKTCSVNNRFHLISVLYFLQNYLRLIRQIWQKKVAFKTVSWTRLFESLHHICGVCVVSRISTILIAWSILVHKHTEILRNRLNVDILWFSSIFAHSNLSSGSSSSGGAEKQSFSRLKTMDVHRSYSMLLPIPTQTAHISVHTEINKTRSKTIDILS